MELEWLGRGALLGFAIAAPVGPIGVLCIRRTLSEGRMAGLASGLGAATADLMYGTLAALGLGAIAGALAGLSFWMQLLGGVFLCYLGLRTLLERPAERAAAASARSLVGAYASTFLLTVTNPATILTFAAAFVGLGLAAGVGELLDGLLLAGGVFLGSAAWWLLLSGGVSLLRLRITPTVLRGVNVGAGLLILGFGLAALASLLATRG